MKKEKVFKPRSYRIDIKKGTFHPQVRILFFWCNLDKACRSKGEADKVIRQDNARRARRFSKARGQ